MYIECNITHSNSISSFHMINSIYNIWLVQFQNQSQEQNTHKKFKMLCKRFFLENETMNVMKIAWKKLKLYKKATCLCIYFADKVWFLQCNKPLITNIVLNSFLLQHKNLFLRKVFDMEIYTKIFITSLPLCVHCFYL